MKTSHRGWLFYYFIFLFYFIIFGLMKVDNSGMLLQSTIDVNNEEDLCLVEVQCRGAGLAIQGFQF